MCRKMQSITVFIKLFTLFFLLLDSCDKTPNAVHGEAFVVQHEIGLYQF